MRLFAISLCHCQLSIWWATNNRISSSRYSKSFVSITKWMDMDITALQGLVQSMDARFQLENNWCGISRFWVSSMMEVVQKIDNQTLKWVNHVSEIGALYRSIPFYEENSTVKHVIKNMSKIMILNKRTNGKWIRKRNKAPLIKYLISNNWSEPGKKLVLNMNVVRVYEKIRLKNCARQFHKCTSQTMHCSMVEWKIMTCIGIELHEIQFFPECVIVRHLQKPQENQLN